MEPRRLLTFRAVAHAGSFSRAADALSLTQPSVSQQVAALEAQVGAPLLHRRPGGLRLTDAGAALLPHVDAIAQRLELAGTQLAELVAGDRATLRLGAFPSAIGSLVPDVGAALRAHDASARVAVRQLSQEALPEEVRTGAVHLALAFQDPATARRSPDGLERVDLGQEAFVAALPPGHRLAGIAAVDLAALADEDWTAPSADGIVTAACRRAGFEPRLTAITSDQIAVRGLVLRGRTVTLVPGLLRDAFVGDVVLRPVVDGPRRVLYALAPAGRRHPLAAPALEALAAGVAALGNVAAGRV